MGLCQHSEPTDSLGQTYTGGKERRGEQGVLHIHGMNVLYCNNNTHSDSFGKHFPPTLNNCKIRPSTNISHEENMFSVHREELHNRISEAVTEKQAEDMNESVKAARIHF